MWSGKASRGAKSESPLQDDHPNTEDIEVWEPQGRMPRRMSVRSGKDGC